MTRGMAFSINPLLNSPHRTGRSRVLMALISLGFVVVAIRAFWLQHVSVEQWQRQGARLYEKERGVPASRGKIVDRSGVTLAVSVPYYDLGVVPKLFDVKSKRVPKLAEILKMEPDALVKKVSSSSRYFYLARELSVEQADKIGELRLPGLEIESDYQRSYPYAEAFANVIGFTDHANRGAEGLERSLEGELRGVSGKQRVVHDARQRAVEEIRRDDAEPGTDVRLSLDVAIQSATVKALLEAVQTHRAKGAAAAVIDTVTGEFLAIANVPVFDPKDLKRINHDAARNRALTDQFEPGSTLKPFSVATAMDRGMVTSRSVFNTAPGRLQIGNKTIHDAHAYGLLTVAEIIQKSSNVGTAKIAQDLPSDVLWGTFNKVGFGQAPKIGLPGAAAGQVRPAANWKPIEKATMSYGHGIAVSLIQLAHAYTVFARDGELIPLTLRYRADRSPVQGEPVFSPQVAREMRLMLEAAASPGGTAPKAQVQGYRVAGKTGTAHKPERGGYAANKYISSFVGFAPAQAPRVVVAVMIDEPSAGQHYGGQVAAPVFSQVVADTLRILEMTPDPASAAPVMGPDLEEGT